MRCVLYAKQHWAQDDTTGRTDCLLSPAVQGATIKAAFRKVFWANPYLECKVDSVSGLVGTGPNATHSRQGCCVYLSFHSSLQAGNRVLFQVSFCLNKDTLSVFECEPSIYERATCRDTDDVAYYPYG